MGTPATRPFTRAPGSRGCVSLPLNGSAPEGDRSQETVVVVGFPMVVTGAPPLREILIAEVTCGDGSISSRGKATPMGNFGKRTCL